MKRVNQFSIIFTLVLSIFMFSHTMAETGSYSCNVIYGNDINSPLAGVDVDLYDSNNEFVGHTQTGADGYFTFDNLIIGESYVAKFFYDAELNTVDIEDAYVLYDHLTTGSELNDIQLLAADVNASNSVDFEDFWDILLDYYVNQIPFPAGSWIIPNWEFTVIDVKSSGGPNGAVYTGDLSQIEPDKSTCKIKVKYNELVQFKNEELLIPIYLNKETIISGLGIIISYNSKLINVIDIESPFNELEYSIRNGEVRMAWTNNSETQIINSNDAIAYIRVTENSLLANGQIEKLKIKSESHILDKKGKKHFELGFISTEFKLSTNQSMENTNTTAYPNPCSNYFTVNTDYPEVNSVEIRIFNTLGQLVKTEDLPINDQKIIVPTQDLQTGNYFYHINTAFSNLKGNISIQN